MPTGSHPIDDSALVTAARTGSLDALAELYRRHADSVHALAYRMTFSTDDAADVLQDVFVGLARALRSYTEQGRFEAWLQRVTVRTCLMRMRALRRRREDSLDDLTTAPVTPATRPLDRIALERALAALPEQFRVVFALKEIEGYSHDEIADLVGITSANSAARLSRAWKMLRKEVER
jgi:RNA polymerase sigma-70 factor (ECF subfamily)